MKSILGRILLTHETITSEQVEQIKHSYSYTDNVNEDRWAQKVWFREIAPLGKDAEGPFVQLSSISTFLGAGCQLLLSKPDGGVHVVGNGSYDTRVSIAIILHEGHYDIIYRRIFGDDWTIFEDLAEADPVNQYFSPSLIGSCESLSSQFSQSSDSEEDITLDYTEYPD